MMITNRTHLQTLSHLQLILVREVLHQAGDLESLLSAFLEQFEGDDLQSLLDRVRNLTRMRSRDFRHGVRLPDHEEVGDLPDVVLSFPFRARPTVN